MTWFLDTATARELNMQTTGHASRGVSSTPSPSATNLHLVAGTKSPEQLIGEIEDIVFGPQAAPLLRPADWHVAGVPGA